MSNALKRFRSALPASALLMISLPACSGGSGNPVAPISGGAASGPPATAAATASPTPVTTASATPVATASPTAKPTATPTAKPTAAPSSTPTPTPTPAPTGTPLGSTMCSTALAAGSVSPTGFVLIPLNGNQSGFQRIQLENAGGINSNPQSSFCQTYASADALNTVSAIGSKDGSRGIVLGLGLNGSPSGVPYAVSFFGALTGTPVLGPQLQYASGFPDSATAVVLLGGTLAHTYTKTGTLLQSQPMGGVISPLAPGGRAAMAADPADPTRIVLTGFLNNGFSGGVQVVSGLPGAPVAGKSVTIDPAFGNTGAVAVSRDGKYAYVATKNGIESVSGIGGTALAKFGSPYLPASAPRLNTVQSLVTTVDGKYLVAEVNAGGPSCHNVNGVLLCGEIVVVPIGANGVLGAPVLVDDNAGGGDDDSMLVF